MEVVEVSLMDDDLDEDVADDDVMEDDFVEETVAEYFVEEEDVVVTLGDSVEEDFVVTLVVVLGCVVVEFWEAELLTGALLAAKASLTAGFTADTCV